MFSGGQHNVRVVKIETIQVVSHVQWWAPHHLRRNRGMVPTPSSPYRRQVLKKNGDLTASKVMKVFINIYFCPYNLFILCLFMATILFRAAPFTLAPTYRSRWPSGPQPRTVSDMGFVSLPLLKGLSHGMIWLLMTWMVSFRPKYGWGHFSNLCSNDFITQKVYFSLLSEFTLA